MKVKDTYYIKVWDDSEPEVAGIGECNLFRGLSADDVPDYEWHLDQACASGLAEAPQFSSIIFGVETALADLSSKGSHLLWPSEFTQGAFGVPINGLVWMGDKDAMRQRIREKLDGGYHCLKLKIGGIDFADELDLLSSVRKSYLPTDLEIRLDANGAFRPSESLTRLERLSAFHIHSIEQPIKAGQIDEMERICRESPIPVALDEELIGIRTEQEKRSLLEVIRPQYIILKPALCGGFAHSDEWIKAASSMGIGWWATSALESNIGLNAIAQWVASKHPSMPQGLGTGLLYSNNIASPLETRAGKLEYRQDKGWGQFNII